MRGLVVLGVVVAALAAPAPAFADDNPAVARRLFSEGRVLYDQGKFIEACVLFEKSYQLDPAVGTKLNLAECAERDHKPRAAWLLWISAAEEFERDSDKRSKFARARADALAPKLATVVVKLAKPNQQGLTIQIAGRDIAPAKEIVDRLDPGAISIVVRAPGREPYETTISVALGGTITVEVPALPRVGGEPVEPPVDRPSRGHTGWWGGAIAGGAVTVLAAGGYVYAFSQIRRVESDLDIESGKSPLDFQRVNALNDEGYTWQTRTRIAFGVMIGGAVVTTLLVLKARSVDRARASSSALHVVPVLGDRVAGAQLQLGW